MNQALLVILGGGCGAVLRELLMLGVAGLPGGFPMPIFIANLVACLFIGVISAPTIEGGVIGRRSKLFLATGMMGGLSTFSSFVWGTDQMLAIPAERFPAVLYLVLSMVLGFMLVRLGLRLGEGLMQSRLVTARRS
jgi:fluoride exporter